MSVALEGADSHLGGTLGGHCYHVNSIIHQSCFSLHEKTERLSLMYIFVPDPCFSPLRTISLGCSYGKAHYWALHGDLMCNKKQFFAAYINFRVFSGEHWEENYTRSLQEERDQWVQRRKECMGTSVV